MHFLSIYLSYIKMHFRTRIEYRSNFFAGIVANFYSYFITYISLGIIVVNFGNMNGWNYEEICLLYSVNLLTYAVAGMFFWTVMGIERDITDGNLDVLLIRPCGVITQIVYTRFIDTFIGQIFVAGIFFCISFVRLDRSFSLLKILIFIISILSGVMLQSGAMIFFGALSFWIKRSLPIGDLLYFDLRQFIQYPLSIFPVAIRGLLTFVLPWAFINYYPVMFFLDKYDNNMQKVMGEISPVIGWIVFALSLWVFKKGLAKYNSSGS